MLNHEHFFEVNHNLLAGSFKKEIFTIQFTPSSLYRATKESHDSSMMNYNTCTLACMQLYMPLNAFVTFVSCALFKVDWLANFQRWGNLTGLLKFHKALSKILLTAYADQLLHNFSLVKLCSTSAISNTSNACSLLAK